MTVSADEQAEWFRALERETERFRLARAAHHDAVAAEHAAAMKVEMLESSRAMSPMRAMRIDAEREARAEAFTDELEAKTHFDKLTVTAREAATEALAELVAGTGPYTGMLQARRVEIERRLRAFVEEPATPRLPLLLESLAQHASSEVWHTRRAGGQRDRFKRRKSCGVQTMRIVCTACGEHGVVGEDRDIAIGCDIGRLCVSCRGKQKKRAKIRFGFARHAKIRAAMRLGLFRRYMVGGRWGERFLTVTIPHFKLGDMRTTPCDKCHGSSRCPHRTRWDTLPAQRIDLLLRAWRFFSIRLNRHWRDVRKTLARRGYSEDANPAIHRAFEWTSGFDRNGHPHIHAWMLSPYLAIDAEHARANVWTKRYQAWQAKKPPNRGPGSGPGATVRWKLREPRQLQPDVTSMWRESLRDAGLLTIDRYENLMLDIRALPTNFGDFANELLKGEKAIRLSDFAKRKSAGEDAHDYAAGWSLAEHAASGEYADVSIFARVYEALEARRIVQSTPGFLAVAPPPACPHCGEVGRFCVYMLDPIAPKADATAAHERAPP